MMPTKTFTPVTTRLARLDSSLPSSVWIGIVVMLFTVDPLGAQSIVPPPGRLLDVGGYHIHLWCVGPVQPGHPTVVLSSGAGGFALDWALVQPIIADSTRVCSYDRANSGWSDLGPNPRTMRQEVFELHTALSVAGERPPYVLVGHSLGGLVVRLFAQAHFQEVAGMVLVDPTHESARLGYRGSLVQVRTLAADRPIPEPKTLQESPPAFATGEAADQCRSAAASATLFGPYLKLPAQEQSAILWLLQNSKCYVAGEDYFPEEMAAMHASRMENAHPLGALPLVVVARGRFSPPPGIDRAELEREMMAQRNELARLSSGGRLEIDASSGHHIHIDNPRLVVSAIRSVVRRATSK